MLEYHDTELVFGGKVLEFHSRGPELYDKGLDLDNMVLGCQYMELG